MIIPNPVEEVTCLKPREAFTKLPLNFFANAPGPLAFALVHPALRAGLWKAVKYGLAARIGDGVRLRSNQFGVFSIWISPLRLWKLLIYSQFIPSSNVSSTWSTGPWTRTDGERERGRDGARVVIISLRAGPFGLVHSCVSSESWSLNKEDSQVVSGIETPRRASGRLAYFPLTVSAFSAAPSFIS